MPIYYMWNQGSFWWNVVRNMWNTSINLITTWIKSERDTVVEE